MKSPSTVRTSFMSHWLLCLAAAVAAFSPGCQSDPAGPAAGVRKLEGAPAQVLGLHFAPDGASVLALERRAAKDESPEARDTYAVSRRPIAGGAAKELMASEDVVLAIAPLGDSVVALRRPPRPVPKAEGDDSPEYWKEVGKALDNTALFRVSDGGAPVRVSPEGHRCLRVVGANGGQWVAYSIASTGLSLAKERESAKTHVLGTGPKQDITLTVKGIVHDISPDGARVLIRRAPAPRPDPIRSTSEDIRQLSTFGFLPPDPTRSTSDHKDSAQQLMMVTVKEETVTDLPASLEVDGSAIDTAELDVAFSGDGLVFRSAQGELYASALDGSEAKRLAGPLEGAGVPADAGTLADAAVPADGGVPTVASAGAPDAGPPRAKTRRMVGPKGTVFELREEAGALVLVPLGTGKLAGKVAAPIARFEGPLSALGEVVFDAAEKRVALAALTDTSRDGSFDPEDDDAAIFVTDASGSQSFGRAPVTLLADELKLKIAAAAGLPESAVRAVSEGGGVKASVELPFITGEKTAGLIDRALVAARAIAAGVPQKKVAITLRIESFELKVYRPKDGNGKPFVVLVAGGVAVFDAAALRLKLRNPVRTTASWSSRNTFSGTLENTGSEETGPIEVVAMVEGRPELYPFQNLLDRPGLGAWPTSKSREVTRTIDSIAPGKSTKYTLYVEDTAPGSSPRVMFRVAGKHIEVFNEYAYNHSADWLDAVLDVRAAHGVWSKHGGDERKDAPRDEWVVLLTAEQAALPDGAREKLLREIAKRLRRHRDKFHKEDDISVRFAAPSGGGWRLWRLDGTTFTRSEAGQ